MVKKSEKRSTYGVALNVLDSSDLLNKGNEETLLLGMFSVTRPFSLMYNVSSDDGLEDFSPNIKDKVSERTVSKLVSKILEMAPPSIVNTFAFVNADVSPCSMNCAAYGMLKSTVTPCRFET